MPYTVNGVGTGLVAASKKRTIAGYVQFDAIEALMVFFLPLIPYRAYHVLSIWQDDKHYDKEHFQPVPLRLSPHLIVKAFLNRYGNVLTFFGAFTFALAGFAFATMKRPFNSSDAKFLTAAAVMLMVGLLFKVCWLVLRRTDERIKDILGPHDLGCSDPYYFSRDLSQSVGEQILQAESAGSLLEVAQRAAAAGDIPRAMYCVRLAQQDRTSGEARELFHLLLRL